MKSRILILVVIASALTFPGRAQAQQPASPPAPVPVDQSGIGDYEIGPGDVLSIRVTGVREFDQNIRVSNSGRIRVPYVGVVFAAGMTALDLEREIAVKIRDHELVNEPIVRVQVDQHRARPVHIVGEVTTPGQFVITGEMYLLDLITRAGGLTAGADMTGILYRRGAARPAVTARLVADPPSADAAIPEPPPDTPSEAQVIPINLDELRAGKQPEMNLRLEGGDVLYVPRRLGRNIYIIGDVRAPGAYTLPRRGQVTAAQAVIYAGGTLLTAKNGAGFLMRHDENGVRQAIPIDFIAIIKGKKPDIPVQADDIIFIPMSAGKTIAVSLLNQIPRLIQQLVIF
jgi:polysaccharide export outer membrane protein